MPPGYGFGGRCGSEATTVFTDSTRRVFAGGLLEMIFSDQLLAGLRAVSTPFNDR